MDLEDKMATHEKWLFVYKNEKYGYFDTASQAAMYFCDSIRPIEADDSGPFFVFGNVGYFFRSMTLMDALAAPDNARHFSFGRFITNVHNRNFIRNFCNLAKEHRELFIYELYRKYRRFHAQTHPFRKNAFRRVVGDLIDQYLHSIKEATDDYDLGLGEQFIENISEALDPDEEKGLTNGEEKVRYICDFAKNHRKSFLTEYYRSYCHFNKDPLSKDNFEQVLNGLVDRYLDSIDGVTNDCDLHLLGQRFVDSLIEAFG